MPKKKLNLSSDTLPLPANARRAVLPVDASAFLDSLARFTEENFSAAARIEIPEPIYGIVPLSPEGSALFFKKLLRAVMGKHFITAVAEAKSGVMTLSFSAHGGIFLEPSECISLIETAKQAEFSPRFEEGKFVLKAEIHLTNFSTVYAHDIDKDAFYYTLCKLFFE